jgi:uncharacterized protein
MRASSHPPQTFGRETFALVDGSLRIVAVADTHGKPHPKLDQHLRTLAPNCIVHAGDIGDRKVLETLAKHAPVTAVRGNIDERASDLPDVITITVQNNDQTLLRMLLLHIAVNGPKLRADIVRLAQSEDTSLVICGHSHVPFATHDRGITVFNPGSVGPKRFALPIVLGVIDLSPNGVSVRHIDCETGLPWRP